MEGCAETKDHVSFHKRASNLSFIAWTHVADLDEAVKEVGTMANGVVTTFVAWGGYGMVPIELIIKLKRDKENRRNTEINLTYIYTFKAL